MAEGDHPFWQNFWPWVDNGARGGFRFRKLLRIMTLSGLSVGGAIVLLEALAAMYETTQ